MFIDSARERIHIVRTAQPFPQDIVLKGKKIIMLNNFSRLFLLHVRGRSRETDSQLDIPTHKKKVYQSRSWSINIGRIARPFPQGMVLKRGKKNKKNIISKTSFLGFFTACYRAIRRKGQPNSYPPTKRKCIDHAPISIHTGRIAQPFPQGMVLKKKKRTERKFMLNNFSLCTAC